MNWFISNLYKPFKDALLSVRDALELDTVIHVPHLSRITQLFRIYGIIVVK